MYVRVRACVRACIWVCVCACAYVRKFFGGLYPYGWHVHTIHMHMVVCVCIGILLENASRIWGKTCVINQHQLQNGIKTVHPKRISVTLFNRNAWCKCCRKDFMPNLNKYERTTHILHTHRQTYTRTKCVSNIYARTHRYIHIVIFTYTKFATQSDTHTRNERKTTFPLTDVNISL